MLLIKNIYICKYIHISNITLPSAPCALPHAAITNGSFTEIQKISEIPLDFKSEAFCI